MKKIISLALVLTIAFGSIVWSSTILQEKKQWNSENTTKDLSKIKRLNISLIDHNSLVWQEYEKNYLKRE